MRIAFRYALTLEDGAPADPDAYVSGEYGWAIGDLLLAGGAWFRILGIEPNPAPVDGGDFHAVWTVERVPA